MVCLEIEKGWAFAFWRYQFKQDIQADVLSMLLWYTRENHPVISCHPVILSYCHTVILVLYADLCRSLGPGDDRNGTTTEGGNEFEDQPGGSGWHLPSSSSLILWECFSTVSPSQYLGILFTSWSHLAVSLQIQRRLEDCKDSANTCMLSLMPYDRFPKIWDLPFASLGILLSVTASSIHLFAPSAPSANDASVQT